jgi:hypothetical protein
MRVPVSNVALDVPHQDADGVKGPPTHGLPRQETEPGLD